MLRFYYWIFINWILLKILFLEHVKLNHQNQHTLFSNSIFDIIGNAARMLELIITNKINFGNVHLLEMSGIILNQILFLGRNILLQKIFNEHKIAQILYYKLHSVIENCSNIFIKNRIKYRIIWICNIEVI